MQMETAFTDSNTNSLTDSVGGLSLIVSISASSCLESLIFSSLMMEC